VFISVILWMDFKEAMNKAKTINHSYDSHTKVEAMHCMQSNKVAIMMLVCKRLNESHRQLIEPAVKRNLQSDN
jgi:hypothetical protein